MSCHFPLPDHVPENNRKSFIRMFGRIFQTLWFTGIHKQTLVWMYYTQVLRILLGYTALIEVITQVKMYSILLLRNSILSILNCWANTGILSYKCLEKSVTSLNPSPSPFGTNIHGETCRTETPRLSALTRTPQRMRESILVANSSILSFE